LLRRRVVSNVKLKLKEYQAELVREGRYWRRYRFDEELLDRLFATICSYLGHSMMANTYNLWGSLWRDHPWLAQYFKFDREARKLTRRYKTPRALRRVAQQYLYYRWRFAGDVVLFEVGWFFEFYAKPDDEIARVLDLAPMGKNSRRARYGFPVRAASRYLDQLLRSGRSVVLVGESDACFTGVRVRLPALRLEPAIVPQRSR
jgi:RNA-directed DNA polymerase